MAKNKVAGDKQVKARLMSLERDFPNATAAALYQEGGEIFNLSQEQVPVDNGDLRQSGVLKVVRRGDGFVVLIGYGAAYALRIHEATEYDANRVEPGKDSVDGRTTGKSKFLEDPYLQLIGGIEGRLAKRAKMLLGIAGDISSLPDIKGRKKGGR